ncbi:sulfatase-like hydrolase/transferase [Lyticum sinuosum]|uniref:Phosphatase/sulfatase family protein n=1 Tax=Lyticum sinuosum TaxID=1332059 RepID=A0AAE4VKZ3_9RICK|nr:sulfatase-like hydrolase/transferase [Lyticum sinuosum]MDZ5761408.1 putative phosphatase/sulfatase family protein [Lyticum sinuosum]
MNILRNTFINKYIHAIREKAGISILPALVFSIFFYIPIILFSIKCNNCDSIIDILKIIIEFCILFFNIFFLYFIIAWNNLLYHVIICVTYACGGLSTYFLINYKIILDYDIIENWYYNGVTSISNLIYTGQSIIISIMFIIIAIFITRKSRDLYHSNREIYFSYYFKKSKSFDFINIVANILCIFWFLPMNDKISTQYVPFNIIKYGFNSIYESNRNYFLSKIDISKHYQFIFHKTNQQITIILVIGNSLVSNAMSINNPDIVNNTPLLKKLDNLISFTNNYLPYNNNNLAFSSVMFRRLFFGKEPDKYHETSIISVMKSIGFKTTVLSSYPKDVHHKFSDIFLEADVLIYKNDIENKISKQDKYCNDHNLIELLRKVINKNDNNFIILHTVGNTWPYHERYSKDLKIFSPDCSSSVPSNCSFSEIINSYNNSILNTDNLLYNIINEYKSTTSILFFVSDQGQDNILNNNRYILNNDNNMPLLKFDEKYMWMINNNEMMVWFSKKFSENYKNNTYYILNKRHKLITIGDIFHSILGCIDVKSDIIDQRFNLCSSHDHY